MVRVVSFCGCCGLQSGVLTVGIIWVITSLLHIIFAIVDLFRETVEYDSIPGLVVMFVVLLVSSLIMIILSGILICGLFLHRLNNVKAFFWVAVVYGVIRFVAFVGYCLVLAELGGDELLFIRIVVLFLELPWIVFAIIVVYSYIKFTEEGQLTGSITRGDSV